jgi:hypothetical protein
VVDEQTGLIAIVVGEKENACDEWLAWSDSRGPVPLLVAGFNASDLRVLPASLAIEAHILPPRRTAAVRLATDCAVSGTLTVTVHSAGLRLAGSVDAVLESGATLRIPFDTCFCSAAAACHTPL